MRLPAKGSITSFANLLQMDCSVACGKSVILDSNQDGPISVGPETNEFSHYQTSIFASTSPWVLNLPCSIDGFRDRRCPLRRRFAAIGIFRVSFVACHGSGFHRGMCWDPTPLRPHTRIVAVDTCDMASNNTFGAAGMALRSKGQARCLRVDTLSIIVTGDSEPAAPGSQDGSPGTGHEHPKLQSPGVKPDVQHSIAHN